MLMTSSTIRSIGTCGLGLGLGLELGLGLGLGLGLVVGVGVGVGVGLRTSTMSSIGTSATASYREGSEGTSWKPRSWRRGPAWAVK